MVICTISLLNPGKVISSVMSFNPFLPNSFYYIHLSLFYETASNLIYICHLMSPQKLHKRLNNWKTSYLARINVLSRSYVKYYGTLKTFETCTTMQDNEACCFIGTLERELVNLTRPTEYFQCFPIKTRLMYHSSCYKYNESFHH